MADMRNVKSLPLRRDTRIFRAGGTFCSRLATEIITYHGSDT